MKIEGAASHLILEPAGERGEGEDDARVRVVSLESAGTILQEKVIARVNPPPPPVSLESAGTILQVKVLFTVTYYIRSKYIGALSFENLCCYTTLRISLKSD
jgi:hypothetical protein